MDPNILSIILAIALLAVAGAAVFAIIKVRSLIDTLDTTVAPKLDEAKTVTEGLKAATEQAGPLMESVNVMMDSADMMILDLDDKLAQVSNITGTVVGAGETASKAVSGAKTSIANRLAPKH